MTTPYDPDRVAIVTGASSGIGTAIARELSRRGQPVLAVARRTDRLDALAAEAKRTGSAAIHPLAVDLTQPRFAERIRDRARELGGPSWLVNNAGFGLFGPFMSHDPERLAAMVRLNCEAVVVLTAAVLPDLVAAGRGVLLNVASIVAFQPTPLYAVYSPSKAFVLFFSESLHEELQGTGVTVSAFCPGPVATEFGQVSGGVSQMPGEIDAATAARIAVDAAERGRAIAVPGLSYKLMATCGRFFPRSLVRRISGKIMRSRVKG